MSKLIEYDNKARSGLKKGVDKLANAVKTTLGPKGRNVVIDKKYGTPTVTKDGVTVAKEIELKDPIENMGAQLVKEVASRTSDIAGDGTTTATVLAQAIFAEGFKNVTAGANPMDLKRGIDLAVTCVVDEVKKIARPINKTNKHEIAQVGIISANNDKLIGELIADAMMRVGSDGVITVDEAKTTETKIEVVEGLQFDRGYLSHLFVTNPDTMEVVLEEDCNVMIVDKKFTVFKDLISPLEKLAQLDRRPLLIIAEDIDGEALAGLIVNKLRGTLAVAAVKAPGFGDKRESMLEDIAILTNGRVISEKKGDSLSGDKFDMSWLGKAKKIIITKDSTTIIEGAGKKEEIKNRINEIKTQIENCASDFDRTKLQERLAKLSGGVAILKIGAASEVEMKEKKARVEDALHATRAAVEEGIVPGGGVTLIKAALALKSLKGENEDQNIGIEIIRKAVESPLRQISENAGLEGSVIVRDIIVAFSNPETVAGFGFNAQTEEFGDLIAMGVIDPAKVTRVALENAASVAGMLLTTEATICEEEKDDANNSLPQGMNYPDMM